MNLLLTAYNVRSYQISGPDWLAGERFDIYATVPAGATKEQLSLMLQHLLEERFRLAVHHETRPMTVYDLIVAKGGPKMREHVNVPAPPGGVEPAAPPAPPKFELDKDGFPALPASGGPEYGHDAGSRPHASPRGDHDTAGRDALGPVGQTG
jgi:uncharacterized protein (TIGR03435 family)